jgi:hypothetical protein
VSDAMALAVAQRSVAASVRHVATVSAHRELMRCAPLVFCRARCYERLARMIGTASSIVSAGLTSKSSHAL